MKTPAQCFQIRVSPSKTLFSMLWESPWYSRSNDKLIEIKIQPNIFQGLMSGIFHTCPSNLREGINNNKNDPPPPFNGNFPTKDILYYLCLPSASSSTPPWCTSLSASSSSRFISSGRRFIQPLAEKDTLRLLLSRHPDTTSGAFWCFAMLAGALIFEVSSYLMVFN